MTDVVISSGIITEIKIELFHSAYECETVVVQATTPMISKDCPSSISTTKLHDNSYTNITSGVVNNSDIQLRGGRTEEIVYCKEKIIAALDRLRAGRTTAGGAGIKLAYKIAREYFVEEGNNRFILATDGDFNTGISSDAEMIRLIEEEQKHEIFLTVLGFGIGNSKDSKMEQIADKGNGNYYYIDNLMEAQKVLVNNLVANLFTIPKDVKIQIENKMNH